jgi:hypothetical protein
MDQDLTKFEQESTKTPIWLPIAGVALFFVVVMLAVTCPGRAPEIGEDEQQTQPVGQ